MFGLGSTWVMRGRFPGSADTPSPEMIVRTARDAAIANTKGYVADHPIPLEMPGQSNTDRLAALDAWFGAFRKAETTWSRGDQTTRDARTVANAQARASALQELV